MEFDTDKRARELFVQSQAKQIKIAKNLLLVTFVVLGALCVLAGALMYFAGEEREAGATFFVMGAMSIIFGAIFPFLLKSLANYDKYKTRLQKYGGLNAFEMAAKLEEHEARLAELEKNATVAQQPEPSPEKTEPEQSEQLENL